MTCVILFFSTQHHRNAFGFSSFLSKSNCIAMMKCVSLSKDLKPDLRIDDDRYLSKGCAKHLLEASATKLERKEERSKEIRRQFRSQVTEEQLVVRKNVGDRTATLGSEEFIYTNHVDCGLFASVLTAYNKHYNLRTSPEDWWFVVTRRVAIAIDQNSKREKVRKMFVEHEGKKTLQVDVPNDNIYDVDYTYFFNEMSKEISKNIKVPSYVDVISADFSSTTPVQKIVSQITVMSSLQEFFEYKMMLCCGIPGVEMLGTEEDWQNLLSKLEALKTLLEPIRKDLGLRNTWWSVVQEVFEKLLATYRGTPDYDWWSRIVTREGFGSGPSGYTGWITKFMEMTEDPKEVDEFTSGLVTVPLTIAHPSGLEDTAALVAGCLGFTIHEDGADKIPSVQPFQGWSLLLPKNSPFRADRQ